MDTTRSVNDTEVQATQRPDTRPLPTTVHEDSEHSQGIGQDPTITKSVATEAHTTVRSSSSSSSSTTEREQYISSHGPATAIAIDESVDKEVVSPGHESMSTEKEVVSFPNTSASSPSQYPEHCPITSVSPPPLTPSEPAPAAVNQDRKLDPSDLIEQPLPAEEVAYVTPLRKLGAEVAWIDCQFCNTRARTRIVEEDSGTTACYGVLLCLICWPLACLPCCLGWAQDINHYCTNCNKQVVHKPYDGQIQIFERDSSSRLPNQIPSKYTNDAPPRYQAQISPQQEERLATSQHVAVGSGQQPVATVEEPARPEGASPQDTMSQGARYG